jgi:hypothetical protein
MAGQYNIVMDRAATFVKDLRWTIDSKPVPCKGYTGFLIVKPDYDSDVVLFDLTSENGEITFDDDGGIHLTCPAEETEQVRAGLYVYDLFVKTDKQVIKMLTGTWKVQPSVTGDNLEEML